MKYSIPLSLSISHITLPASPSSSSVTLIVTTGESGDASSSTCASVGRRGVLLRGKEGFSKEGLVRRGLDFS